MNILIPLAGKGSRFKNKNFKNPKPLILINNKTMIERVIRSIKITAKYHFIIQEMDNEDSKLESIIKNTCKELNYDCNIIKIKEYTNGSTETCLYAEKWISENEQLIILNCDQIMDWNPSHFINFINVNNYDGVVITKKTNDKNYSYILLENNLGIKLAEKETISENGLLGVHYWKKSSDFFESAKHQINNSIKAKNEYYLSLSYNYLIKKGKKITNYEFKNNEEIDVVGTPDELYSYLDKYNINFKLYKFENMKTPNHDGGWFIGNFEPSVYKTNDFEVGHLFIKKDEATPVHYHNNHMEINYIIKGKMSINNKILEKGDIFLFDKNVISSSYFYEDTQIICVKTPSLPGDKIIT
tara:strand:- start:1697 stop:2764 length:1068 start_codon:yes stop_codon:yes gene_type:complete